jgi:uncharacterized protein YukE
MIETFSAEEGLLGLDNNSIAFTLDVSNVPDRVQEFSKSSIDDEDVFFVYSILVSSNWNKNDDVFLPAELVRSYKTPRHKPANFNHEEKLIIGSIVDSWLVDSSYNIFDEDRVSAFGSGESAPDDIHILVSSVVYTYWRDPEYRRLVDNVIAGIKDGTKKVSMECIFKGFDYAVKAEDGSVKMLQRNEETAFLTKHLRAYGGEGVYQDKKIARALREITFRGKGFVDNPANPNSITIKKEDIGKIVPNLETSANSLFLFNSGVKDSCISNDLLVQNSGDEIMSNDNSQAYVEELKNTLAGLKAENKELEDKVASLSQAGYETKISDLTDSVATLTQARDELIQKLAEAEAQLSETKAAMEAVQNELHEAKCKMDDYDKKEKAKMRKDKMVMAGLSEAEADSKISVFESLSDDQFEAIVETLAAMMKKEKAQKDHDEDHKDEDKAKKDYSKSDDSLDPADLTNTDSDAGASHSVAGSDQDDQDKIREALASWIESNVLKMK